MQREHHGWCVDDAGRASRRVALGCLATECERRERVAGLSAHHGDFRWDSGVQAFDKHGNRVCSSDDIFVLPLSRAIGYCQSGLFRYRFAPVVGLPLFTTFVF